MHYLRSTQCRVYCLIVMGTFLPSLSIGEETPIQTDLPPMKLDHVDANNDGKIDKAEFEKRLETLFISRDDNNDGFVSTGEIPQVNKSAYQRVDEDQDNRLSKQEYIMLRQMDFKRLDTNEDEILYPHEILKW